MEQVYIFNECASLYSNYFFEKFHCDLKCFPSGVIENVKAIQGPPPWRRVMNFSCVLNCLQVLFHLLLSLLSWPKPCSWQRLMSFSAQSRRQAYFCFGFTSMCFHFCPQIGRLSFAFCLGYQSDHKMNHFSPRIIDSASLSGIHGLLDVPSC